MTSTCFKACSERTWIEIRTMGDNGQNRKALSLSCQLAAERPSWLTIPGLSASWVDRPSTGGLPGLPDPWANRQLAMSSNGPQSIDIVEFQSTLTRYHHRNLEGLRHYAAYQYHGARFKSTNIRCHRRRRVC